MFRFAALAALGAVALAPALALAQPAPGGFQVVDVKANNGKITWNSVRAVPVRKVVEVTVNVNGMNVVEKREITVYETVTYASELALNKVKVTNGAGKVVDAEKAAEQLKEGGAVVLVSGPVAAKHRALFKETTLIIEMPAQLPPMGGPDTAPVAPAVEPIPAPPVVLPPGVKPGR
ncbi:MAG: hypothetical protein FJ304_13175 [Planctomycetes bacterium]|nr:hypothetical protein [Planctomycetota bacterium]